MNSKKVVHHIYLLFLILSIMSGSGNCRTESRRYDNGNETAGAESSSRGFANTISIADEVGSFITDMWSEGADMVRILWKECSKKIFDKESKVSQDFLPTALQCVKRKTLKALDRTLSADTIPLAQGVELVRYQQITKNGKIIKPHGYDNLESNSTARVASDDSTENNDWKFAVLEKMVKVFNTHVLKVDVARGEKTEVFEPRHRRRNQMMQMMMFGIMSMGMILVPMGFQFLAVLGGKALLLAKFALILSSIQALKKASSGSINYAYPPLAPVVPEHTFEKRGYDTPITETDIKSGLELQTTDLIDNTGKIAYRFDHDTKAWKAQPHIKRMDSDVQNPMQNVYPVYSMSQNAQQSANNEMRPVYSGYQSMVDAMNNENMFKAQPTAIRAEYTIDLPIEKVQLKTTSPFITTATQ